tara:strand:- start:741 stop:947 length:207 start_codon:yes stop_codon:yes gene_type:complete
MNLNILVIFLSNVSGAVDYHFFATNGCNDHLFFMKSLYVKLVKELLEDISNSLRSIFLDNMTYIIYDN